MDHAREVTRVSCKARCNNHARSIWTTDPWFSCLSVRHAFESVLQAEPLRGALDCDAEFFEFAVEGGTGEAEDLCASSDVPRSAFERL